MTGPDRESTPTYSAVLFGACLLVLAVASILYLAFLDRQISFDEIGLFNPSYMLLHYGRITYPIHGHFDDMVIHPPTHYLILALWMKLGFSLFHAAAVMPILSFLAAGCFLLSSPFEFSAKIGLLFGAYLAAVVWTPTLTVRPDVSLALAWIAGLIGLEAGRLANWDPKRLFAGSLFLVYAATLHYPAAFCWTGVLVYVVWVCRRLPWRKARVRVAAMGAGIALIGIPYLVLFLIPYRHEIAEVLHEVQGEGGLSTAFHLHIVAYKIFASLRPLFAFNQPLVQTLLTPLWTTLIPAAFIGPLLLLAIPSTRGLALAALPQVLFIALGARHKDTKFAAYFTPELFVYLAGVITWMTAAALWLAARVPSRLARLGLVAAGLAGFTGLTLRDKPSASGNIVRFTLNLDDIELGRAAGREIVGPGALVGAGSLGGWYTGGADHFYMVAPEVLYGPSFIIDPQRYFARFDGVVVDSLNSWVTWNKERVTLTSLYVRGDLHLKGFWFDDNRANTETQLSWMMFAAKPGLVRGYALHRQRMYRFDQAPDGDSVFFCAVCQMKDLRNNGKFESYLTLLLPPAAGQDDPRSGPDTTLVIRTLLVSKEQFQRDVLPQATRCQVRDQIAGRMVEVDSGAMLARLQATDSTIRFYRSFATALGGTGRLNAANTNRLPGVVAIRAMQALNPQSHVVLRGGSEDVRTAPTRWWDAASITINHAKSAPGAFLYIRGKVLDGVVGISIRGHEQNSILGSEALWGSHDGVTEIYIPIASFDDSERVVIRNQRENGQSEILIEDAAVVAEKPVP
jgi:hypothetical protein